MKVLFCGGRNYDNKKRVLQVIKELLPTLVITGGARGLDTLADEVAKNLGIPRIIFPANWEGDGKAAGILRNIRMLDFAKPDLVVAFPGGRGTSHCVSEAGKRGITVKVVR